MRILLVMDPFIKVPPDHYGGIERVVADLADGLARSGHDVTLWAAPGSRVNGRVDAFGREGEWTRWSNVRNTLTLAGRFLAAAFALRRDPQLRPPRVPRAGARAGRARRCRPTCGP